ncbi:hypothetical protein FE257_001494 [Aspergillus nanangensis]|uniref:Beta-galactosidase n=1 Tax=Aspergillus nanangensis TaxID=2582783 RepID=A0AAD4GNU3_ASPNN|nr:hypothetical protein FE257_001494 [Aspergillus nanangensis]
MVGGQMDPYRVPRELWDDRMEMARAMGLNTIFSYIYWDQLEPQQGNHSTDGKNDIAAWIKAAEAHDLKVVLRPGPYICGEHDYGGLPFWLMNIDGMKVRTNNKPFLDASAKYLKWLGSWLEPYFANNGGPVLMAQIENEYGFYGNDHDYTNALADIFVSAFPNLTLYTNDGSGQAIKDGSIPGFLAVTDGSIDGFKNRDQYIDKSSKGPYLDGEYYITWIDKWGQTRAHESSNNSKDISQYQKDFKTVLDDGNSINIYMFHGGTNWGFSQGANWDNAYVALTTSYDYGAPLDESGRPNAIYHALRSSISKQFDHIPDVPSKPPMRSTDPIEMKPYLALFDALPTHHFSVNTPQTFEDFGQQFGFILYRWTATEAAKGTLTVGDGPRDRVMVFVNNRRVAIIDSRVENRTDVHLDLHKGDVLDLLVENYGRVNFGPNIADQRKGIVNDVRVGDIVAKPIHQYKLPCDQPGKADHVSAPSGLGKSSAPAWYRGTFDMEAPGDTWLDLPGWIRGVAYVNGHNLGRYWTIGPQQQLYVPGVWLKLKNNVVTVLNLEITGHEGPIQGVAKRSWGNNDDPDGDAP